MWEKKRIQIIKKIISVRMESEQAFFFFYPKSLFKKKACIKVSHFINPAILLTSVILSKEVCSAIQFWDGSYSNSVLSWREGYTKKKIRCIASVYILRLQGSWLITEVWGWRLAITAFVLNSGTLQLAGILTVLFLSLCCPLFRLDIQHTIVIPATFQPCY